MTRSRFLLTVVAIAVVGLTVTALGLQLMQPSNSRNWKPDHDHPLQATFAGDHVTLWPVRNNSPGAQTPNLEERTFNLSRINSLWYVLSVFDESQRRGPAHAMLSFGFDDGDYVVISVEARKEVDESYSTVRGLFNQFELIYVAGDERDFIGARAVDRPDDVYLYPVRTTPNKIRDLFVDMLTTANTLHEQPEFYNTLTQNCTSRLRDHVNRVSPGRVPATWTTILPGYSDKVLSSLGLIDDAHDFEAKRKTYWINQKAAAHRDAPDFSARIRAR